MGKGPKNDAAYLDFLDANAGASHLGIGLDTGVIVHPNIVVKPLLNGRFRTVYNKPKTYLDGEHHGFF